MVTRQDVKEVRKFLTTKKLTNAAKDAIENMCADFEFKYQM